MPAPLSPAALELCDVVKDYDIGLRGIRLRALNHVSLRIERGQIFGLLGPNGSGKSTALKLLAGLVAPSAGTATILGQCSEDPAARASIGYVPDAPRFPGQFTGREVIEFAARLSGLTAVEARRRGREALERVGLAGAADRTVRGYSKGMYQRLGLGQALVHDPAILILDEPTAGLDLLGLREFGGLLQRLKTEGRTVLLTSHHLEQLQEICDAAAILDAGRLRWVGPIGREHRRDELEELYLEHVEVR